MYTQDEALISSATHDLPADALQRAERFLRAGDLSTLTKLPLRPCERIEAAEVLLHASKTPEGAPSLPLPTLSAPLYARLHAIAATAREEQAGAALFILATDFQARACNLAMLRSPSPLPSSALS